MKMRSKFLSMLLALAMVVTAQTPLAVLAADGYSVSYEYSDEATLPAAVKNTLPEDSATYESGTEVTAKNPSSTRLVVSDTVYTFDGWDVQKKTIEDEDVTFTGSWSKADVVYRIEGTVYQYEFAKLPSTGTPKAGIDVVISLKSGSVTVTTDSNGKFTYELTDNSKRTSDGKYDWSIAKTNDTYAASGTAEEGTEDSPKANRLNVRERYIPKTTDFEYVESDTLKKIGNEIWIKAAGNFQVKGTGENKIAKTLDGEAEKTQTVSISSSGSVQNFFIYIGTLCSKILSGQTVHIDSGAPSIVSVTTEAANENTFVKEHGIYGKQRAEIILNASISEESSIKEAYLVSTVGEETRRYDATAIEGQDGKYNATIGLPDAETIMNAQLVELVAVDVFDNASEKTLIAQTEDGSKVTLEQIAPSLRTGASEGRSSYGWYKNYPNLTATASDNLSGLDSLRIYGHGHELAFANYDNKTLDEHSVDGNAAFDEPTEDGHYQYTAEAKDNAGNVATEAINVKIDLVAPKIEATGAVNGTFYKSNPVIKITEDEMYYKEEGNRIIVKVIRDGKTAALDHTYTKVNAVTIPESTFSQDGEYVVTIQAKDAADNESNVIKYSFTKDATAPVLTLSGVSEGKYYNKRQKVTLTVKEHNWQTNNVTVRTVKKLGGSVKNMGFPWTNKGEVTSSSTFYGETGTYTVTASAVDKAGNQAASKKVSFTVDTKAPVITITGVKDKGIYTYGQGVSPKVTVTDDYLASKSVVYTKGGQRVNNPSFSQIKENDGLYTLTVTATDKAGNSSKKQISWTVNRFGSYFVYENDLKNVMGKALKNVDTDLVITEKNLSKVVSTKNLIYRDGKSIENSATTSESGQAGNYTYKHVFGKENFETEGAYELNVVSEDEVGNEMESQEENGKVIFYVDRTAPTLSVDGIDPKGINAESATLTVNTKDLLTGVSEVAVTVDGNHPSLTDGEDGTYTFVVGEGLRQKIEVTSTDKAGNEATFEDTVSVSTSAASLWFDRIGKFLLGGLAAAAILGAGLFFFLKRKKDDEENSESV